VTPVGEVLLALLEDARHSADLPGALCRHATRDLAADGVAIALALDETDLDLHVASDSTALALERLQLDLGEGPCLEAHRTGSVVVTPDLWTETARWPVYAKAATTLGIRSVHAFPLQMGGIRLGVMDVYRRRPGHLDEQDVVRAMTYADVAVLVVLHLHGINGSGPEQLGALEEAFSAHPEIHQATGMVSVQAGTDLRSALLLIRARAFVEGRTMLDVAVDVIDRVVRFT
jgi:GAF domain-containing protein